jgi:hypothetical protein
VMPRMARRVRRPFARRRVEIIEHLRARSVYVLLDGKPLAAFDSETASPGDMAAVSCLVGKLALAVGADVKKGTTE